MNRAVIDASVAVKWFLPEENAAAAARLQQDCEELLVPDLLYLEVASAVWKRVRRHQLTPSESAEILERLARVLLRVFPSRPLVADALKLSLELGLTVYDAVYVALARSERAVLITADEKILRIAKGKFEGMIVALTET